jgi:hypothetical protein
MRKLLLATALSFATSAAVAQTPPFTGSPIPQGRSIPLQSLPTTVEIKKPDGQFVGTATRWGNSIVYRDANGEIAGSSILATDGKQTHYDPHGKIVASPSIVAVPEDSHK